MDLHITLHVTPFYSLKFTDGCISTLAATTPIYLQEANISGKKRAVDTMVMVLWGIGGISVVTWFDYAMLKAPNNSAWRVALAMQAFFSGHSSHSSIWLPRFPQVRDIYMYLWIKFSICPL
jgi:hypothetical protein